MEKLLGKQDVVTYRSPRNERSLGNINQLREESLEPISKNFRNNLIGNIATRDRAKMAGGARGLS